MVLGKPEILRLIDDGKVVIDPFDKKLVEAATVKLTLGELYLADRWPHKLSSRRPPPPPPAKGSLVVPVALRHPYSLAPGDQVVAGTKEAITLPDDVCAWITPRARTAVLGLNLDIATGFIQPGTTKERLFFAIRNPGRSEVILYPGVRICQLVLNRVGE
jgi:deoxycytidine triphosphate deaminase